MAGRPETGWWIFLGHSYTLLRDLRKTCGQDREIPLRDAIDQSVAEMRQPFIDYIGSITTDNGSAPTIYSGLVERVPFRSNVFLNICLIDATITMIRSSRNESITIICENRSLAYDLHRSVAGTREIAAVLEENGPVVATGEKMATAARVILHAGKIAAQLLVRRGMSALRNDLPPAGARGGLIILHTWMAQASIGPSGYREMFFSDLREHLAVSGEPVVLIPHVPYDIRFSDALGALRKRAVQFIAEESFLTVPDILRIFFRTASNFPPWSEHRLGRVSFSHAAYLQNFQDWLSLQLLVPTVSECVIAGLARRKVPIRSLIFTYENNAWEKAFIGKLRRLFPNTTCIGYQHSTTTPNFLYYYLSASQIDRDYVPDYVITNGDYPTAFLKRNNYPLGRVLTGGALRYRSETPAIVIPSGTLKHNNRIVITPPGIIDEATELLEKVYEALGPIPGLDLQVKIHPFLPQARLEKQIPAGLVPRIHYTDRPVHELVHEANLLVYSTTSTCIEALSAGVPVLKIRSEHRLDLDPLGDFQGSTPFISVATQPDDIRDAVMRMKELELTGPDQEIIRAIVLGIFGPVDGETYRKFTLQKGGM